MVFEAYDIDHASPVTVSRCTIVACDPAAVPWRALVVSWRRKAAEAQPALFAYLAGQIDKYVPALVQFLGEAARRRHAPTFAVASIRSLRNVYFPIIPGPDVVPLDSADPSADALPQTHYFAQFADRSAVPVLEPEDIPAVFERVFLFCAVWTFGGLFDDAG
jgi:hypothetical protein